MAAKKIKEVKEIAEVKEVEFDTVSSLLNTNQIKSILYISESFGSLETSRGQAITILTQVRNELDKYKLDREMSIKICCQALDLRKETPSSQKYIDPITGKSKKASGLSNMKRDLAGMINASFDFGGSKLKFVTHKTQATSFALAEVKKASVGIEKIYASLAKEVPGVDLAAIKILVNNAIAEGERQLAEAKADADRLAANIATMKQQLVVEEVTSILTKMGMEATPENQEFALKMLHAQQSK